MNDETNCKIGCAIEDTQTVNCFQIFVQFLIVLQDYIFVQLSKIMHVNIRRLNLSKYKSIIKCNLGPSQMYLGPKSENRKQFDFKEITRNKVKMFLNILKVYLAY